MFNANLNTIYVTLQKKLSELQGAVPGSEGMDPAITYRKAEEREVYQEKICKVIHLLSL